MLRRLIYVSRSTAGLNRNAIEEIVSSSSSWNANAGVTGLLWVTADQFAQVIEGPADAVALAMDRIRADPRHEDIDIILNQPTKARQFGSWSMRLATGDDQSEMGTAFMVGFACGMRTAAARRLYEIVVSGED